ncbi:hypothetical protein TNCV_4580561 [Trichonephila clavipes]|nr:hypothetical protein TNCV_4580561 [Trichonephila clavipes]
MAAGVLSINATSFEESALIKEKSFENSFYIEAMKILLRKQLSKPQRKVGSPRTRWMDKVEKWLKDLGVNRWKNIASNKSKWSKLTEIAFAGNRL